MGNTHSIEVSFGLLSVYNYSNVPATLIGPVIGRTNRRTSRGGALVGNPKWKQMEKFRNSKRY